VPHAVGHSDETLLQQNFSQTVQCFFQQETHLTQNCEEITTQNCGKSVKSSFEQTDSGDENLEAKVPGGGGRVKEERKRERLSERAVVS
jgi:hypothetical protein